MKAPTEIATTHSSFKIVLVLNVIESQSTYIGEEKNITG